jgi:hypothetical protein
MNLRASIFTALENVYGPREWNASLANIDEGEEDAEFRGPRADTAEMTYREIGEELGLCSESVRRIETLAFRKIRQEFPHLKSWVKDGEFGHHRGRPITTVFEIDCAIRRAKERTNGG